MSGDEPTTGAKKGLAESIKHWGKADEQRAEVQKYKERVVLNYGSMHILGMRGCLPLEKFYVDVNLREKPRTFMHLSLEELEQGERPSKKDGKITHKCLDALKTVKEQPYLMLLGEAGAGKTTFLKYLALQAVKGRLRPKRLPVFIDIKTWADSEYNELPDFIVYEFNRCGFSQTGSFLKEMLAEGKCLLLLDGLDKAGSSPRFKNMQAQIRDFAYRHNKNQFVVSCRTGAYSYCLSRFFHAELAKFDNKQWADFIRLRFTEQRFKAEEYLLELEKEKNVPFHQLISNPLGLSLLCLIFEQGDVLPTRRSELYEKGLTALLKTWDHSRFVRHPEHYQALALPDKHALFSRLAQTWLETNRDFVSKQEAEQAVVDCLPRQPGNKKKLKGADILEAIEIKHGVLIERASGIYSFVHLAFQEYYSARYFREHPAKLNSLLEHMGDRRWREVFLFASRMLPSAEKFLAKMQVRASALIANQPKIKELLVWAHDKAAAIKAPYHPLAITAAYLYLARELTLDRNLALDMAFAIDRDLAADLNLELDVVLDLVLDYDLFLALNFVNVPALERAVEEAQQLSLYGLVQELECLKVCCPKKGENPEGWESWTEDLRQLTMAYRNLGHNFGLGEGEVKLLRDYLYASKLIVECLQGESLVSKEVREKITGQLLLLPKK